MQGEEEVVTEETRDDCESTWRILCVWQDAMGQSTNRRQGTYRNNLFPHFPPSLEQCHR